MLMVKLGWNGRAQGGDRAVPGSGFGVFMMRQYAGQAVSDELVEAARVDGCSTLRIYWSVVLPALRPAAAVLGAAHLHADLERLPLAVRGARPGQPDRAAVAQPAVDGYYTDYAQVFAGTALATLPLLVVFVCSAGRSSAASWKVR